MWTTIALIVTAVGLLYKFLTWNFDYWQKRGIKSPKPSILLGNFPNAVSEKKHMVYDIDELYRAHKHDEDFLGVFSFRSPQLLITSPMLVRQVYVNDFKYFHDNDLSEIVDYKTDIIVAQNPFALTGEAWKERRALLTPGLTMSRINAVYPVTNRVCRKMCDYIEERINLAPKGGLEARDLALRFTTDVVTDCVLGLEANSFTDKPTPILSMINRLFGTSLTFAFYFMIIGIFPFLKKYYKSPPVEKDVENFFIDLMQKAINMRKSQPDHKERIDFLNYLLQMQEKKNLTAVDMTSTTMTFLIDGFETTATVLASCLLMLSRYPDTQDRLRDEILKNVNAKCHIDFEKLTELPYLDACVHEAIRIFPPGFFSTKLCTEPIVLNGKNGRTLKLEKGLPVILPVYSIMVDEEYYANPQEFQPERFLAENGATVKDYRERGLYYGFGDGPRVCIGMNFALTQIKAALVDIIQNFYVRVNPKTRKDNLFDAQSFAARLEGGIWLDFELRN